MSHDSVLLFSPDADPDPVVHLRPLHLGVDLRNLVAVLVIDDDRVTPFAEGYGQAAKG
jgi:hypothetical protein